MITAQVLWIVLGAAWCRMWKIVGAIDTSVGCCAGYSKNDKLNGGYSVARQEKG